MAGDGSLGVLFDHSFISVSFDPDHTGKDPDFILDPWPRARPDIFLFSDFKSLWPIEDAQVEHVLIR